MARRDYWEELAYEQLTDRYSSLSLRGKEPTQAQIAKRARILQRVALTHRQEELRAAEAKLRRERTPAAKGQLTRKRKRVAEAEVAITRRETKLRRRPRPGFSDREVYFGPWSYPEAAAFLRELARASGNDKRRTHITADITDPEMKEPIESLPLSFARRRSTACRQAAARCDYFYDDRGYQESYVTALYLDIM